jgi:hypothetical protein
MQREGVSIIIYSFRMQIQIKINQRGILNLE